MGSSEDFYKRDDSDFWKGNDDDFWNSDERYIRNDERSQDFITEPKYDETFHTYREEEQNRKEKENAEWSGQTDVSIEYKRYGRFVKKTAAICTGIMLVSILLTVIYIRNTKSRMEQEMIDLNYTTESHEAEEVFTVNNCDVKISDACIAFDSDQIWMPAGKKIIGVYIEAESKGYGSDGGITKPYLGYGDGSYCYPIRNEQISDMLIKAGFEKEDMLSSYSIGSYGKDTGYFFFLVEEENDDFSFFIDERERGNDRIEYLRVRHIVSLGLDEWRGGKNE